MGNGKQSSTQVAVLLVMTALASAGLSAYAVRHGALQYLNNTLFGKVSDRETLVLSSRTEDHPLSRRNQLDLREELLSERLVARQTTTGLASTTRPSSSSQSLQPGQNEADIIQSRPQLPLHPINTSIPTRPQQVSRTKHVVLPRPATQLDDTFPHTDMIQQGLYPKLIGIGCQKCGTTSLAAYMAMVDGFQLSGQKEIHAFGGDMVYHTLSEQSPSAHRKVISRLEWYGSKWSNHGLQLKCDPATLQCSGNAQPDKIQFEFTPRYLPDFRRSYNMRQLLPMPDQVKFVAILRHPVSRAWSSYHHVSKPDDATPEEFDALIREELRLLDICYNTTLAMLTQANPLTSPNRQFAERRERTQTEEINEAADPDQRIVTLSACRHVRNAYANFQQCVNQHAHDPTRPWFVKYTQNPTRSMEKSLYIQNKYMGFALMGLYADQLYNYLCAGFKPEQFIILTSHELKDDPVVTVKRIADFMGQPLEIHNKLWFERGLSSNRRSKGRMPVETQTMLENFFRVHNRLLAKLLTTLNFDVDRSELLKEFDLTEQDLL
eukprot:m.139761 g.139761  ORF g.139761 m.139761 type:complete len:549 (+) comp15956_c0_seq2:115-1761(+)